MKRTIATELKRDISLDIKTLVITAEYHDYGPCFVVSSVISSKDRPLDHTHETAVFGNTDEKGNGGTMIGQYQPKDLEVGTLIAQHEKTVDDLVCGELRLNRIPKEEIDDSL